MLNIFKRKDSVWAEDDTALLRVPDGYEVAHIQVIETSSGEVVKIALADRPLPADKILGTLVPEHSG